MAWHTSRSALTIVDPSNSWWTTLYDPGDTVPVSGIYSCQGCRSEITCKQGEAFPPRSHHPHLPNEGMLRWRLIVRTNAQVI
ncbi:MULTISPECIES: protein L [Stenotrophomonas]|uniref:protein L n=1 Tax=Stenotrophomonas TaxID=40323 RepID=UPI0026E57D9D|nr:protein L [Stenotrophomonas sp. 704A1]